MNSKKTSKINDDIRFYFGLTYFIIAIILLYFSPTIANSRLINMENAIFWETFLRCLTFTFFGFSFLILKICINSIEILDERDEESMTSAEITELGKRKNNKLIKRKRDLLRHCLFYPVLLLVIVFLSAIISINQFYKVGEVDDINFLIRTALLSFFLGFFIDSLTNIFERLGKALTS
jgi:hypothetical protein